MLSEQQISSGARAGPLREENMHTHSTIPFSISNQCSLKRPLFSPRLLQSSVVGLECEGAGHFLNTFEQVQYTERPTSPKQNVPTRISNTYDTDSIQ